MVICKLGKKHLYAKTVLIAAQLAEVSMNLKESIIPYPGASNESEKRLHGRWLMLARIGWIVVAVLAVILIAAGAPLEFRVYQTTISTVCSCPQFTTQQATELTKLGISLSFYAGTLVAFQLLFVSRI